MRRIYPMHRYRSVFFYWLMKNSRRASRVLSRDLCCRRHPSTITKVSPHKSQLLYFTKRINREPLIDARSLQHRWHHIRMQTHFLFPPRGNIAKDTRYFTHVANTCPTTYTLKMSNTNINPIMTREAEGSRMNNFGSTNLKNRNIRVVR